MDLLDLDCAKVVDDWDEALCRVMLDAISHDQENLNRPIGRFEKVSAGFRNMTPVEHRFEQKKALARNKTVVSKRLEELEKMPDGSEVTR